jgi:octaprenyl-diphosphate synthase
MNQAVTSTAVVINTAADLYAPISRDLEEVERLLARSLENDRPRLAEVIGHVNHYRGKRLRPALLLLVGKALGRLTPQHHLMAAVVELVHTATLVHDDVLDGASMRRHVATVNARWGNHNSILLGDYLFTHAFHLSATIGDARVCEMLGETTNRVCEGELCQGLHSGNLDLSEDDYFDIIDGKTAELIACAAKLGALFSHASREAIDSMERFGRNLGMAFQIADDLLDLLGEEKVTGKSLGTDLELQKLTLPMIRLLSQSETMRNRVKQMLTAPGNHKREALQPLLEESDAIEYTYRRAEEFTAAARAELEYLPPSPCRAILEAACDRVVHRNS